MPSKTVVVVRIKRLAFAKGHWKAIVKHKRSIQHCTMARGTIDYGTDDPDGTCCLLRVILVFVVVIVETLLLINNYTLTPWFLFSLFLVLLRPPPRRREDEDDRQGSTRQLRSSRRQPIPRDEEEANMNDALEMASNSARSSSAKARTPNNQDGFSLIKNSTISIKDEGRMDSLRKEVSSFQDAVDKARSDVSVGEIDSKPVINDSDSLDGTYKLEYENDGKLVTATMELEFTSGFGGWTIQGTRNNPGEDGIFRMRKGFLAQSGRIYWEERAEFEPQNSVLVRGKVTPDGPFRGDWLGSDGIQKGIVTEFHRVGCVDDEDSNSKLTATDLV